MPSAKKPTKATKSASKKTSSGARPNKWLMHVNRYRSSHPGVTYAEALKAASKTYRSPYVFPSPDVSIARGADNADKIRIAFDTIMTRTFIFKFLDGDYSDDDKFQKIIIDVDNNKMLRKRIEHEKVRIELLQGETVLYSQVCELSPDRQIKGREGIIERITAAATSSKPYL